MSVMIRGLDPIRYRPTRAKIASAVAYVLTRIPAIAAPDLAWIFYRAERRHLNDYGRPVMGLNYGDDNGCPKCREVLDLLVPGDMTPVVAVGGKLRLVRGYGIERDLFSVSDFKALDRACGDFARMNEAERRAAMPHGWNAGDHEWLGYENMIEGRSEEEVLELASIAPYLAF
jgi:hypothetical protein|nr:hypothetical protein [Neorhizobium tomejilense]